MNEEERKESSIPVSARISVLDLARLDWLWLKSNVNITSISQLVNWSLMEFADQAVKSGAISDCGIETIRDAHNYLKSRGIYQKRQLDRSKKRLGMALAFETLREGGHNPKLEHPRAYNMMHSKHSIKSRPGADITTHMSKDEVWELVARARKQAREEVVQSYEESRRKTLEDAEKAGVLVESPQNNDFRKLDEKELVCGSEEEFISKRKAIDEARARMEREIDESKMDLVEED